MRTPPNIIKRGTVDRTIACFFWDVFVSNPTCPDLGHLSCKSSYWGCRRCNVSLSLLSCHRCPKWASSLHGKCKRSGDPMFGPPTNQQEDEVGAQPVNHCRTPWNHTQQRDRNQDFRNTINNLLLWFAIFCLGSFWSLFVGPGSVRSSCCAGELSSGHAA